MATRTEADDGPHVAPARALWRATAEVVSVGQQVVIDRVELLRTELADDLTDLAIVVGGVVAAGVVLMIGWVMLAVACAFFFATWIPWTLALGIVALLHVVGGGVLAQQALHRFRRARRVDIADLPPPTPPDVLRG